MARLSKYENENTPLSITTIQEAVKHAKTIDLQKIEEIQEKFGVSDAFLAEIMGVDKSQISRFKKLKSPVPMSGKIALYLMFKR